MLQTMRSGLGTGLLVAACAMVLVGGFSYTWSSAQTTGRTNPPLVIPSMYGADLFAFYCASCHGRDGKGGGPVVVALNVRPPDLTTIAERHGRTFPREWVESFVIGNRDPLTAAHGSKDMPVWGPIFRGLDANDQLNRLRIESIVGHIESIQQKE